MATTHGSSNSNAASTRSNSVIRNVDSTSAHAAAAKKAAAATQPRDPLPTLVKMELAEYLTLEWLTRDDTGKVTGLHPAVDCHVRATVGGPVLELRRTDLKGLDGSPLNKPAVPMAMWDAMTITSRPENMGNKKSPQNPAKVDTKLRITVAVDTPHMCSFLKEMMQAHEIAAWHNRAAMGFDDLLSEEGVRRSVRRAFGYTPPIPKGATQEQKNTVYLSGDYPRLSNDGEYAGSFRLDIVAKNVVWPNDDNDEGAPHLKAKANMTGDAQIKTGLYDAMAARERKNVVVTREQLRWPSTIMPTVALCGLHVASGKSFQWWRLFEAIVVLADATKGRGAEGLSAADHARVLAATPVAVPKMPIVQDGSETDAPPPDDMIEDLDQEENLHASKRQRLAVDLNAPPRTTFYDANGNECQTLTE